MIVRARDSRGALMAEAVGREDRTPELSGVGADTHLAEELVRIGGGRLSPSPEETLLLTKRPGRERVASWPYALLVAAALVVVDLVLRRLGANDRKRLPGSHPAIVRRTPPAPPFRQAA